MQDSAERFATAPYGWGALLALLAALYLTLLPFEFSDLAFADAWRHYLALTPGRLSASGRQQWIANVLMFLPLGFFLTAWLTLPVRQLAWRLLLAMLVAAFCLLVTATVEFLQIWLPYRHPSLIDMSGNFLGGVLGAVLWLVTGRQVATWVAHARRDGVRLNTHQALLLYVLCYFLVSLLPFDFLLSLDEWRARLASSDWHWWRRADFCTRTAARCALLDLAKLLLTVPLGWWLARRFGARPGRALLVAILTGFAVEATQILLLSGRADGYSGLLRATGAAVGAWFAPWLGRFDPCAWRARWGHWLALASLPLYLMLVGIVGLATLDPHWDLSRAWQRLAAIHWLPLYRYYFVSEAVAMRSLLLTLLLYAPLGGLLWLGARQRLSGWLLGLCAASLGVAVELVKAFGARSVPDPTGVLLAVAAVWATARLLESLTHGDRPSAPAPVAVESPAPPAAVPTEPERAAPPRPPQHIAGWPLVVAGALICGALWAASTHPLSPIAALLAVGCGCAALARWPRLWLVMVPAALPVLDLTPWTGRLYVDEWDLLVLTALAALWARRGLRQESVADAVPGRGLGAGHVLLALSLLSYLWAVAIALWPPGWPDALDFATLHTGYNALRLAKGLLSALMFWPFLKSALAHDEMSTLRHFALGMVLGLAAAVASVLWERLLFTGLFDFSTSYRAVGMFSATHTGGAFLEAYLVAAVPFLAVAAIWRPRGLWIPFAVGLFLLATYAIAVTFARAGYAGMLVGVLVLLASALTRRHASRAARVGIALALLVVGGGGLTVLGQVQRDAFMRQRVATEQIQTDWAIRAAHWQRVLTPVFADARTFWLGLGVGRFPERQFWDALTRGEATPALPVFQRDGDAIVLNLLPGRSLYFWQAVAVAPETTYQVRIAGDAGERPGRLMVAFCEKWILYSRRCVSRRLDFAAHAGTQTRETNLRTRSPLTGLRITERPVKLILYLAGDNALALHAVSLRDPTGRELLANGDFARGLDRWFFTSDDHLAWRIENLWVQVWYEQGVVGFALLSLLTFAALVSAWRGSRRAGGAGWYRACVLASLLAFLVVGSLNSLFDAPRLATLFFLLVLLALWVPASLDRSRIRPRMLL